MAENKVTESQENPLANILINVIIPVLALSYLSKDPALQEMPKIWHIGPLKALIVALLFPISYGIWFFIKTKKMNFFSGLGLFSVMLTGGLTLFLWNEDGSIKENAAMLFGLKEASIPFILGLAILFSARTKTPLIHTFLYNDSIFDIRKIESKVKELDQMKEYKKALFMATVLFATSFFLSTLMNFGMALMFLGDLDHTALNAREVYNDKVAKITGWGFLVIGVPVMGFLFITLQKLLASLRKITGLNNDELMMPR